MSEKHQARIQISPKHDLVVRGWPQRPFLCTRVFSDGNSKFAVNAKGEYFSNLVQGHRYCVSLHGRGLSIVKGLLQLGLKKNQALVQRVADAEQKAQEARRLASSANEFMDAAKDAGIKITSAQIRKAKKLIAAAGKWAR